VEKAVLIFIIGLILLVVAWRWRLARTIRVNQGPPLGFTLRLAHNCKVTGISQPQAKATAATMMKGNLGRLELRRDPMDRYAVEVIAHWQRGSETWKEGLIGYVPRQVAAKIAEQASDGDLQATISVLVPPRLFKSPGVRMDIWTRRKPPEARRGSRSA
jgi:hypothetical protein